jgi:prophage DNA circulation protein
MPTKKPRIAILVTPATVAALDDLADASGKTRATTAAELLAEIAPQLHDTARYLRALKAGKTSAARSALRDLVGSAAAEMMEATQPDLLKAPKGKR